jgi:hypothetical protein
VGNRRARAAESQGDDAHVESAPEPAHLRPSSSMFPITRMARRPGSDRALLRASVGTGNPPNRKTRQEALVSGRGSHYPRSPSSGCSGRLTRLATKRGVGAPNP